MLYEVITLSAPTDYYETRVIMNNYKGREYVNGYVIVDVITSYSIHYTKLYDYVTGAVLKGYCSSEDPKDRNNFV